MITAMNEVKLIKKISSQELIGLEKTLDGQLKANRMQWYGLVVLRDNDNVFRKTLDFEECRV